MNTKKQLKKELESLGLSEARINEILIEQHNPLFNWVNTLDRKGFIFNEGGNFFTLSLLKLRKPFNPVYMLRVYILGFVFAFSFEHKDTKF